ncbi:MAG: N-acetylornithine carbamoyltransferase [Saprospiraceae bacterium]
MKRYTSIKDVPNVQQLLQSAKDLKANPLAYNELGKNKTLVLLFFNPSLRTRLSTQKAAFNLGMNVISMNAAQGWKFEFGDNIVMNTDKAEHIKEAAAVISQYADIIGVRTFPTLTDRERDYKDVVIEKLIEYASVPVVSLESAILHPLQSLTDLLTIEEHKKTARPKVVLTWAPHPKALPQCVSNSFVEWIKNSEVDLTITHPKGFELAERFTEGVRIEHNQHQAFADADFIYAKNWSAYHDYGKTADHFLRKLDLPSPMASNWQITAEKMALTNNGKFMHCLPVRRNVVVADAVLDSPNSLVIEQANNRTYAAQAVLKAMLDGGQTLLSV